MISDDIDELLCYCEEAGPEGQGIRRQAWLQSVREHPELDFYQLCDQLKVGRRCTACLLNAEALFDGVARTRGDVQSLPRAASDAVQVRHEDRQTHSLSWRKWLYGKLDAVLPTLPTTHELCIPVVRGQELRTVLTLSNCFPSSIGMKSAPYQFRLTTLDAGGNTRCRRALLIDGGDSKDIDLTDDIGLSSDEDYATGSCWIAMRPVAHGFSGSTRPHFKLVGPKGVSAVHAQSKSPRHSTQIFSRQNLSERHLIHMINVEKTANPYFVRTKLLDSGNFHTEVSGTLPPRGAALVELPIIPGCEMYLAEAGSQGRWRYHYMIADSEFARMSADHA